MSCIDLLDAVKNRVCDRCKSSFIIPHANLGNHYQCQNCNRIGRTEDFPKATVFDQITASPEALAVKLVYWDQNPPNSGWTSSLIRRGGYKIYRTKPEAIAATVAKLKEVCHE